MTVDIPEIEDLRLQIQDLAAKIDRLIPNKLWFSRQDLAALKGVPVSAFYNKPWLLPGEPSKQGGTDRWSCRQVIDSGWIWMSDEDLKPGIGKRRTA